MRRSIVAASLGTVAVLGGGALATNLVFASGAGAVSVVTAADATDGSTTLPTDPAATAVAAPKGLPTPMADALAKLVTDGTLTQAQADAVTAALEAARPSMGEGRGGRGPGGPGGRMADLSVAADALGVTADEVRTALQSGTSLAELAASKGVDVQKVIDALVADAKAKLAQAVTDGRLTQAEADTKSADLSTRITDLVNGKLPVGGPGGRGGRGGHGPMHDGATDSATADATSTTA
ncbi:MAG: hypothetical protein AB7V43_08025 [Acidimicrobiia bacterium]